MNQISFQWKNNFITLSVFMAKWVYWFQIKGMFQSLHVCIKKEPVCNSGANNENTQKQTWDAEELLN